MTADFSLRRSIGLLTVTTIVTQIVNAAMVLVLARLYQPAALGYLSNVMSAATILAPVGTLQLALALPQQRDAKSAADVVTLLILSLTAFLGGLAVILSLFASSLFAAGSVLLLIWPAALCLTPFIAVFDLGRLSAARDGAFRAVGVQNIIVAGVRAAMQLIGGALGGAALWLLLGEAFGRLASLAAMRASLVALWRAATAGPLALRQALRTHWRFPLIAMPSSLLDNAGGYLPPILLGSLYGVSVSGLYFLAQRVVTLPIVLLTQTTADVVQVRAAQIARQGEGALLRFVLKGVGLLTVLGIGVVAALLLGIGALWHVIFTPRWDAARDMAYALLLPALFQTVTGPMSRVLVVANRQSFKLLFDVTFLAAALSPAFFPSGPAATPHDAVWRIATGYLVAYVVYLVLIVLAAAFPVTSAHPDDAVIIPPEEV